MLSSLVLFSCLTQAIQQNSKCPLCRNNTKFQMIVESNKIPKKKKKILSFKKEALIKLLQQPKKLFVFQIIIIALNIEMELKQKILLMLMSKDTVQVLKN